MGTWRNYLAYHDIQQIQAASRDDIFVLASNDLYQYNKADQSIVTYDKTNGLSDTHITHIRWCQQAKRLVAVYSNTNIDFVETNGNIINLSSIYNKTITGDKSVNSIFIQNQYAYLACGFGIVKLDVKKVEVSESYMLGFSVTAVTLDNNNIYARSASGVWMAPLNTNLIDKSSWQTTNTFPSFTQDNSDYDEYYSVISTLQPGGPKYNEFYEMKFLNNQLYAARGEYSSYGEFLYSGAIQVLQDKEWTVFQEGIDSITGYTCVDINCLDVDPLNPNHVFAAGKTGLYEFMNGKLLTYYNEDNSPLVSAYSHGKYLGNNYCIVKGIKFDAAGNLFIINNHSNKTSLFKLTTDKQWVNLNNPKLYDPATGVSMHGMRQIILDSRGLLWWVNEHWNNTSVICYDPEEEKAYVYNTFTNQDGTSYTFNAIACVAEDLEGNIWVGSDKGPFYIAKDEIGSESVTFNQVKVPRNDGTNFADYLLNGINITSIAVDAGGRKWFGTSGNGVYLISADNMTQVQHFEETNSYLTSNIIKYISINKNSGEVFFATNNALCSYMSDATTVSEDMTTDNVYAYPNPVQPNYTGLITVVGLSLNADVKILSASGKLIAQGRSNGGSFTWDGCDANGHRVASGIYMVATAKSNGEKGTVCKIAIVR